MPTPNPRDVMIQLVGRIRSAREQLEAAERELDEVLGRWPAASPATRTAALTDLVATVAQRQTGGGESEPIAELGSGALRDAVVAVATGSIARSLASHRGPSTTARVLAVLLEDRARDLDAATVSRRCGCSEAVARTTLHRLVATGHARRTTHGSFRASDPPQPKPVRKRRRR